MEVLTLSNIYYILAKNPLRRVSEEVMAVASLSFNLVGAFNSLSIGSSSSSAFLRGEFGSIQAFLVQRSGWTRDTDIFFQWLSAIPFGGGGFNDAAIAEGLAEALMMKKTNPDKYQSHFSSFVKKCVELENMEEMYKKVHFSNFLVS